MIEEVFVRRTWIAVGILVAAAAAFLISYEAVPVLLLIFLAILLGIFIRALSEFVCKYTGWRFRWGMITVTGGILGLLALAWFVMGSNTVSQISGVINQLPDLRRRLEQYGWTGILYHIPGMEDLLNGRLDIWSRLTKSFSFSETFGPLISIGLVFVIGLYLAGSMNTYVEGAVNLCFPDAREDCRHLLDKIGDTLRWWLLGEALGMLFIGIVVGIGLELMGMPLAVPLAIFAGLMAFVPNLGYFFSIAPAILLAALQSQITVFYVLFLYTGAHWGNDYVVLPLIQKRTVRLPPALTVSMQLLLGFLLGGIGLIIATPLTAVLLVMVETLYLESWKS